MKTVLRLFLLLLLFAAYKPTQATHFLGGEFHWQQLSQTTFDVYFVCYRDRSGVGLPGTINVRVIDKLSNSCNNVVPNFSMAQATNEVVARALGCTQLQTLPNYGASRRIYYGRMVLPGASIYELNTNLSGRPDLANVASSPNGMVALATIDNRLNILNRTFNGNSRTLVSDRPEFELLSIACLNEITTIRQPFNDPEGDSVAFEMVQAMGNQSNAIGQQCLVPANYQGIPKPNNYLGPFAYNGDFPIYSYKPSTSQPGSFEPYFQLDPVSGVIQFRPMRYIPVTQPNQRDNKYVMIVRAKEYRRINGSMRLISTRDRNMIVFVENCDQNATAPSVATIQSGDFQTDSLLTVSADSVIEASPSVCSFPTYRLTFSDPDTVDLVTVEPVLLRYFNVSTIRTADSLTLTVKLQPRPDSLYALALLKTPYEFVITVRDRGCPFPRSQNVRFRIKPYITPGPLKARYDTACNVMNITSRVVYKDSVRWVLPDGSQLRLRGPVLPNVTVPGRYISRSTEDVCFHDDTLFVTLVAPPPTVSWPRAATICGSDTMLGFNPQPGVTYVWIQPNGRRVGNTTQLLANRSGNYILESSNGHCAIYDTLNLTVLNNAKPLLGADKSACTGDIIFSGLSNQPTITVHWVLPGGQTAVGNSIKVTTSGAYVARAVSPTCVTSDTVLISVLTPAPAGLPRTVTSCTGQAVLQINKQPGLTYLWRLPNFTWVRDSARLVATISGRYILETSRGNCPAYDTVVVNVGGPLTINAGPNRSYCAGQPLANLTAATNTGTITWTLPNGATATGAIITPTVAGDYIATGSQGACTISDTVSISILPLPARQSLPRSTATCDTFYVINLNAQAGTAYSITQPDGTVVNGTSLRALQSGLHVITATRNGCQVRDSIELNLGLPLTIDLGPDRQLCPNEALRPVLSATAIDPVVWMLPDGSTASGNTLVANQAGQYIGTVTSGFCSQSDTVVVSHLPLPLRQSLPRAITTCDTSLLLAVSREAGVIYSFRLPGGQTLADTARHLARTSGRYIIEATKGTCLVLDTVQVNLGRPLSVNLGSDRGVCANSLLQAQVVSSSTQPVSWLLPDGSGVTGPSVTAVLPGRYIALLTDGSCLASDTVNISFLPLASRQPFPRNLATCDSLLVLNLAVQAGVSYTFILPGGFRQGNATQLEVKNSGQYIIEANRGGCLLFDTVDVEISPLRQPLLGNDRSICRTGVLTTGMVPPTGTIATWQTPRGSFNGLTLVIDTAGQYILTFSLGACTQSDTIQISQEAPVQPQAFSRVLDTCSAAFRLNRSNEPGVTYSWILPGGTVVPDSLGINITTSGQYIVRGVRQLCERFDTVQVNLRPTPVFSLGNDITLCPDALIQAPPVLGAGATVTWRLPNGSTVVGRDVQASLAGSYIATASNGFCAYSDTLVVALNPVPPRQSLPAVLNSCDVITTIPVVRSGPFTYIFTLPSGQKFINVSAFTAATSGRYIVETYNGLCYVQDTVQVNLNQQAAPNLPAAITACGQSLLQTNVTVQPGGVVSWADPAGTITTAPTLVATVSGQYIARINWNGCLSADTINVTLDAPLASTGLARTASTCANPLELTIPNPVTGVAYTWILPTGQQLPNQPSISVNQPGLYQLQAQRGTCSRIDSVDVTFFTTPQLSLGIDFAWCGTPGSLNPVITGSPVASYAWQTPAGPATSPTVLVTGIGQYILTVTTANGCQATDTMNVFTPALPAPHFAAGATVQTCRYDTTISVPRLGAASYVWITPAGLRLNEGTTVNAGTSGLYQLEVTADGCIRRDSLTIIVNELVPAALGADREICQPLLLEVPFQAGVAYLWQTPAGITTGLSVLASQPGQYVVTVSKNGCQQRDTINISFTAPLWVPVGISANGVKLEDQAYLPLPNAIKLTAPDDVDTARWVINGQVLRGREVTYDASQLGLLQISMTGRTTAGCPVYSDASLMLNAFKLPTAFTPNGDGRNDYFEVIAVKTGFNARLTVTNRWGQKVYHSNNYDNRWDASDLPAGTYFYLLEIDNLGQHPSQFKGWVQVLK